MRGTDLSKYSAPRLQRNAMETVKQCQLCDFRTSSMAFLLKHLTTVHSSRPSFNFSCGLNGCLRTFGNITTYKHHVYAAHSKYHTNLASEDVSSTTRQDVGDVGETESAEGDDSSASGIDCGGVDEGNGQNDGPPQAGIYSVMSL